MNLTYIIIIFNDSKSIKFNLDLRCSGPAKLERFGLILFDLISLKLYNS